MVKTNKITKSSLKTFLKIFSIIVLCGFFIATLLFLYTQNRMTSLQYLDKHGATHTIILPVKDKNRLTELMLQLFAIDSFAYSILGSKPVAWGSFQNPLPFSNWTNFYDSFSEYNRTMRTGWKTWEKYQYLFTQAHLWAENPKCYPGSTSILIINEERFNDVVIKNKKDFREVLGREIEDGFQLINEAKNRSLMNEVLEGHQGLIGIVLGYGRDNSWKFLEACENKTQVDWVWENEENYFGEEENFVQTNDNLTDYYLSHFSCPSFAGEPNSEESLTLKFEYFKTKKKIIDYYKNKDFLEATLSLLAGYHPPN